MKIDDRLIIGFLIFIVLVAGVLGTLVQGKMDSEKKIKDITEIDCNKLYDDLKVTSEKKCKDFPKIKIKDTDSLNFELVEDLNTGINWTKVTAK
jgi:hypothetical protein